MCKMRVCFKCLILSAQIKLHNVPLQACHLQIHNAYSIKRGIKAKPPLSFPNAKGIILAHGWSLPHSFGGKYVCKKQLITCLQMLSYLMR